MTNEPEILDRLATLEANIGVLFDAIEDIKGRLDEIVGNVREADDPIAKMIERQRLNPPPPNVSPEPAKD